MVLSSWNDIHYIHRCEDLVLIKSIVKKIKPKVVVEFGTFQGGFAGEIAETIKGWNGILHTIDFKKFEMVDTVLSICKNITFHQCDILSEIDKISQLLLNDGTVMLYTDNGNKMKEIELYAPFLKKGDILGTHDYGTEVDPIIIEKMLKDWNFKQLYHEKFKAFEHPTDYPHSLTRFWIKGYIWAD